MADALISFLIDQLVSTAFEQIKENVRLVLDVEEEVDQFIESLKTIQAALKDAENRRVKEAVVQDWLDKLKGVSYDMDNVLDEWNTQALKQQIQKQENEGENVLVNKKKDIKDLNSRLTKIAEERHRYQFQSTTTSGIEQPQRPKTSSLVDVSKIFGREHEKHTLISMLLGHSTSTSTGAEERGPLVIPVVGMGGMGKTTLAQLAYNDENVKTHFKDFSKWVCVSDPFDEIKIAKTIIGGQDTPNSDEFNDLMQSVSRSVKGKKFLLVLDDVWTEDDTKWEQLKLALMSGAQGSRILVTTRKETVARMMGATTHMIHLEKLSEQICSSLFYHIAFLDRKKDKSNLFEAIGNEIVKKCNGLPLAAKTLGSLMRYKNTTKEWQDVLDSQIWKLEVVEEKVFRPLLLSYYDLKSEIKRCLLLCASFPKDHKINKDGLIELWMSQNYLISKRNKEKRAIGQEYFDDLVMRSFFQDFENDNCGNLRSCKMHDIVHDFVQFLTRNECFIIEGNGANQAAVVSSDNVHHLTFMTAAEGPLSLPTPFCKKLRSLTIFSERRVTRMDGDLILQFRRLRALNLSRSCVEKVPKEIGQLLHLRYIDLSWNGYLKELPDAMCNLWNLETLHLEWCRSLEKLPKAMGKLINLKHLYLFGCDRLRGLPKGVGRLRILDRFVCGGGDDKEILELGDLGSFDHLQGTLGIEKLGNVKDVREAQKAQLEKKKHLLELTLDERMVTTIDWDLILQLKCLRALNLSSSGVKEVPKEIGELLHLRYIDLSGNWELKELPDAMCNLCNLETLHLEHCWNLEKLPKAMGKLINLKHLYVDECNGLRGLPKGVGRLRILDRFVCGGGDDKEILDLGDLGSFDHLQGTLAIRELGKVKDGRDQAQKAQLEKKKHLLELILDFSGYRSEEQRRRISDEEVLNALRPPQDLKYLRIFGYQGTSVPPNWIMSLQHLTHLSLYQFKYCESLPPLGKLPYLEVLYIAFMRRVEKVGVEWLGIEETQTSPATAIAFPKLKQLQFYDMYNWEEWEGVGDDCQVTIMPCLSSLSIQWTPELKQVPDFLLHNRPQLKLEVGRVHPSLVEQVQQREEYCESI